MRALHAAIGATATVVAVMRPERAAAFHRGHVEAGPGDC
jgi:hypothetical protein